MTVNRNSWLGVAVLALMVTLMVIVLVSQPARAAGPWYIAPSGSNSNTCLSAVSPCATINGALGKPGFVTGDTVLVATGTYTGTGTEVVSLNIGMTLSGGWNSGFTTQNGMSTIDGQEARRGMTVNSGVTATVERFVVQNGFDSAQGGGLHNSGALTLNNNIVNGNVSTGMGGGIFNGGIMTITNTTISGNSGRTNGGGIENYGGTVTLNSSTVSDNTLGGYYSPAGSGIDNSGATFTLNNSTVSGNTGAEGIANYGSLILNNSTVSGNMNGGISNSFGTVTLNNSTVSGNIGEGGIDNINGGTLTLTNSTISGNTSQYGSGGGINSYGTLTVNNSTVSGNMTNYEGGGILNHGTATLNNSTVSDNVSLEDGGGVYNQPFGVVFLQNTIIARNRAANPGNAGLYTPDCGGAFNSSGYNLIGITADCTFTASTGDLLNIDAGLFTLIGTPGYLPLLPGSPAIDAGNPAGCTDNMGNPLTTDQRGVARVGRCDIGAYEYDPNNYPIKQVFLPLVARNYCSPFSDNFSNPASGWPIADDGQVRWEYLNGEYRILVQPTEAWAGARPDVKCSDYTVAVDVRNATGTDGTYGLIFGLSDDWQQFYTFEIAPDGTYYLWRNDSGNWTLLLSGYSPSINTGTGTNRIKIERVGAQIKAYANNQMLINTSDGAYTGVRHVGLIVTSYSQPNVDARFDNFVMCAPGCSGAASLSGESAASSGTVNPTPPSSTEAARGTSGSKITQPSVPRPYPDAVPTE